MTQVDRATLVLGHVTVSVDFEDWVEDEDTRQRVKQLRRAVGQSNDGPVHAAIGEKFLLSLEEALRESGLPIDLISYGVAIAKPPKRREA